MSSTLHRRHDKAVLDDLAAGLDRLSSAETIGEISWGLRQVVYEKA